MAQKTELKSLGYEIFIAVLSVISIFNLIVNLFVKDPDLYNVFIIMNSIYSIIFLGDFTYRLLTAPSKSNYFFRQFGWADLLASLPFEQTKILRVFRLVRVYRLMRKVGPKTILDTLVKDRAGSALIVLLLMGFFVLEFGSFAILKAEQGNPDANIKNASDAIWYTMVTISTVGYGDRFPTTDWGRIIGGLIIIVGVGIFGTFTGYLANLFLSPQKKEDA